MEAARAVGAVAVGDIVLIQAEVRQVVAGRPTLVVAIGGFDSGMISYTPAPLASVRQIVARADPR